MTNAEHCIHELTLMRAYSNYRGIRDIQTKSVHKNPDVKPANPDPSARNPETPNPKP